MLAGTKNMNTETRDVVDRIAAMAPTERTTVDRPLHMILVALLFVGIIGGALVGLAISQWMGTDYRIPSLLCVLLAVPACLYAFFRLRLAVFRRKLNKEHPSPQ